MQKSKGTIICRVKLWSILLACIASLLCITPEIVPYSMLGYLKYSWILPLLILLTDSPRDFIDSRLKPIYVFTGIMVIYAVVMQIFSQKQYIGMNIYDFVISTAVVAISFVYLKNEDKAIFFRGLCVSLTAISLILALLLVVRHLMSSDLLGYSSGYEFKNTTAFSLCCILALIYSRLNTTHNSRLRLYYAFAFVTIATVIVLLRSRATYLCLGFLLIYIVLNIRNRRLRISMIIAMAVIVAAAVIITPLNNLLIKTLILGNRDFTDINLLSSFRLSAFEEILESMPGNWLFGIGSVYLDCYPIQILFSFGILGAIPVFTFLVYLGIKASDSRKNEVSVFSTPLYLLFFISIINCIFEAYPPFGPGLRCFLLWISYAGVLAETPVRMKHGEDRRSLIRQ